MKRRDFLLQAAALAGTAGISAYVFAGSAHAAAPAPDPLFEQSFPDVDGRDVSMKQWLGKPVVVNFWATWCPPCVKEMPDLDALHKKYPGAAFLGLAVDTSSNVRVFTEKVSVSYPLLLIGHKGIALMRTMGNKSGGLPFTVVFDAGGREKTRILGQVKPAELEQTLQGLLA